MATCRRNSNITSVHGVLHLSYNYGKPIRLEEIQHRKNSWFWSFWYENMPASIPYQSHRFSNF